MLSEDSMNEMAQPLSAAAVGSGGEENDEGFVGKLISHFESALETERLFYGILLAIWLAFALFGLLVVIWHSGLSDRFDEWREGRGWKKSGSGDGEGDGSDQRHFWASEKEIHPIYEQHTEKERQFRGTSPSPRAGVPTITGTGADGSFFDYGRGGSPSPAARDPHTARPSVPRKGTFGSLTSLAGPGQAFLKMSGRGKSDDGRADLTNGGSSEKYNSFVAYNGNDEKQEEMDEGLETPPPIWVNRWYRGAIDTAKSILPTRGERHGAALARKASTRTEQSFGASQVPTPSMFPPTASGWAGSPSDRDRHASDDDNELVGRALDGLSYETGRDSRYPTMTRTTSAQPVTEPTYPRRLSRAPTLSEGMRVGSTPPIGSKDIFEDPLPPPLPIKGPVAERNKHDSIDYLYEPEYESRFTGDTWSPTRHDSSDMVSLARSSMSYAQVESANRVQTGTAALAAILANMNNDRRTPREERRDPFATPFDGSVANDSHAVV